MLSKRLAMAIIGLTFVSAAALAQNNAATSSAPSSSKWMTQMQPGQWQASKFKGLNVYNNNNEKIGDISELIIDQSGKIQAAVIGVGGFLGMGEHDVAVPFNELKWMNEPPRSASNNPNAPGNRPGSTTGTGTSPGAARDGSRTYPDHALLNMTKDQLKAAPEFKYTK
jgi:sporulation protein YlmC with PRC-barrel domain